MLRLVALALTLLGLSCGVAPAQVFIVTTCGTVPASQATLTAGRPGMLFIDTTGVLCTTASGGGGGGTSSNFGAAFPAAGTAVGFTDGTNLAAGRVGAVSNVAAATGFLDALGVCQYLASAPTLTDTRYQQCLTDINGNLKVNVTNANANGQATPANSSPTVQAGMQYETVAASVTAQVLGGSGATGDYLSHCVVYPTTTTPGVVTVFDNANAAGTNAIAFPGGASSVSNLVPFAIPVGAFSAAGPWKVTTGANLVVTCYGRFT